MNIPVTRPHFDQAEEEAVTEVLRSGWVSQGPKVARFEAALAEYQEAKYAVATTSCTTALHLVLAALEIGPGDEVVLPAFTFVATANAVEYLGATPVFADIEINTFNVSAESMTAKVTPRTRAIIPVHLFGLSADMDPILDEASRSGVPVIEDAAQAIGATYKSRPVGGLGALGCFSFFPSKNLGAFGDAGLLTTNNGSLARRARLLRTHGMEPKYYHHLVGANFRMDALQAAVLRVKAPHLAAWTEARRVNASRYMRAFADAGLAGHLGLPVEPQGRRHIFNQFVIRTAERDALKRHLDARGIGNEIYYPVPFHLQPCFAALGHAAGDFPHAERAARETLAIPIYGELTPAQQQTVVETVAEFVQPRVS
jgi:dTDP-4-amino-4,6-dideoxygalactose transaminase